MNEMQKQAITAIEAAQKAAKERTAPWMVGEQLKDICRREPACAELILADLGQKGMGLADAEKKIKAFADKNRTGSFACVTPDEADRILRGFYGLPDAAAEPGPVPEPKARPETGNVVSIFDYL